MSRTPPLVLVVDDEPANIALLRKVLTHRGYGVVEAVDGRGALRAVDEHRPDLVCLDILMPDIDGFEVCRRLRARHELDALPILLITALSRPEDKARGLEAGANDFLVKPFDVTELYARIRSLLRSKALQDRLADLLGRYVSETVAEQVLRDPFAVSLGGDRRRVSTLFADIRGYTALAAEHEPEQMLDVLNCYLGATSEIVEARGGTVAELLGDGIFAFFGAPVLHADDPERAVLAALDIQERVARIRFDRLPEVHLQAGIGVTTGEVIAGNVGSERRMHYAVIGDSVNVASRLQEAAGPGQVLVDEPTYAAVADRVVSQDLGGLRLAGKAEWVRAFSITGRVDR